MAAPSPPEWFEDAEFWDEVAPLLFDEARMEATADEVDSALSLLGTEEGGVVLDLCCGVGRHALELARREFVVTGVDRTERLLARARNCALEESLDVEWVASDMREFRRAGAFDAAINLFSSFGYFPDPEDDRRVVKNVFESLRPEGAFLIDTMGREVVARDFVERDWRRIGDHLLIEKRTVRDGWDWIDNEWTVLHGARRYERSWGIRLYSGSELKLLLLEAGFERVDVFGSLTGAPYDPEAERLVVVGRRGE